MYIKVHESRQSNKSYLLQYRLAHNNGNPDKEQDKFVIENEAHKSFIVVESQLFTALDNLFKGLQNEKQEI